FLSSPSVEERIYACVPQIIQCLHSAVLLRFSCSSSPTSWIKQQGILKFMILSLFF
ncbi:hypothetical protein L9F63_005334, partial [Diploptera punctata]